MFPECVTTVGAGGFTIRRKPTKAGFQGLFRFKPSTGRTTRNPIIPRSRGGVNIPARVDAFWSLPLFLVLDVRAKCFGLIALEEEGVAMW